MQNKDDMEVNINRDCEPVNELPNSNLIERMQIQNGPPNTSWHNCRRMIYVPRTNQKGFPLGKSVTRTK